MRFYTSIHWTLVLTTALSACQTDQFAADEVSKNSTDPGSESNNGAEGEPGKGDDDPDDNPHVDPTLSQLEPATAVGATDGEFSVGQTGDASYAIALNLVPGTGGIQPNLSLTYNSSGGDSPLGIGWSLSGQSTVARCGSTVAQDGFADGVDFDDNDKFCLDGQRLVAVMGSYGANGTEYRTEVDTLSRIYSYGTTPAGSPEKWLVYTNTGQILQYGFTNDSRVEAVGSTPSPTPPVSAWVLNRVEDRLGNYMILTYHEGTSDDGRGHQGNEHYLTRIDYTGNTNEGLQTYAAVVLEYEPRPDALSGYESGALALWKVRLKRITNVAGPLNLRTYSLFYEQSAAAGRSQLVALQECGLNGACLPPTTFGNANGTPGLASTARQVLATPGLSTVSGNTQHETFADLDGDGDLDRTWIPEGQTTIYASLWGTTSFGPAQQWLANGTVATQSDFGRHEAWIDMNGDGKTDRIWVPVGRTDIYVALSTGTGFDTPQRWLAEQAVPGLPRLASFSENGVHEGFGDIDGDGLVDYLWSPLDPDNPSADLRTYAALNTGSGFATPFDVFPLHANLVNVSEEGRSESYVDLNNDGLVDYAWIPNGGSATYVALGNDSPNLDHARFDAPVMWLMEDSRPSKDGEGRSNIRTFDDMNGDGLADLVFQRTSNNCDEIRVSINTGQRFLPSTVFASSCNSSVPVATTDARDQQLVDLNDDGRSDHVWIPAGRTTVHVAYSTGTAFGAPQELLTGSVGVPVTSATQVYADIDGDGATDRLWIPSNQANGPFHLASGNRVAHLTDSITNGFGREVQITYDTLANPDVYTQGTGAVFPALDVAGSMTVVAQTSTSDGLGGYRTRSYRYEGLRMHLQGLGNLGMRRTTELDEDRESATIRDFSQDYARRLQGMLAGGSTVHRKNGSTPNDPPLTQIAVTNEYANEFITTVANGTFRPRIAKTETIERDLDNNFLSRRITENVAVDEYGNTTTLRASTYDANGVLVARGVTLNTYENDPDTWSLGLLLRTEVTRSLPSASPAVPAVTRVSTQTWDVERRLVEQEVVEPDDANLRVTTTHEYNGFGNRTQTKVEAIGVETRISTQDYDGTGRFLVESTDAEELTSSAKYDLRRGLQLEATDVNNLTTTFDYDDFGRRTLETRPDGSKTRVDYLGCDSGCPALAVYGKKIESDGAAPVTSYYDVLGREVRSETLSLTGRKVIQDHGYDILGRKVTASEPYFSGDRIYQTKVIYDSLDRAVRIDGPDGKFATVAHQGPNIIDTNELNQKRTEVRNVLGQIVQVIDHDNNVISFAYDAFENPTQTRDPDGNVTTIIYDNLGRKVAMDDPDMGYWTYDNDALGQLVSQTDAKNQVTSMGYDKLGRLVQRFDADGTSTLWTYDTAANGKGALARVTQTDCTGMSRSACIGALESTTDYRDVLSYDVLSRPTRKVTTIDGESFEVSNTYDSLSRVDVTTYPRGAGVPLETKNTYNARGYLSEVTDAANGASYWRAEQTDARGNNTLSLLGNGLSAQREYDPATGFLRRIQTDNHGVASAQQLAFEFDTLGNLRSRRDELQNVSEVADYDSLNRLKTIETRLPTGTQTQFVSYGRLGNIEVRSDVGDYFYGDTCDGVQAGPHAVTSTGQHGDPNPTTYCYDANGNMIRSGERQVDYSSYNKPVRLVQGATETLFAYGPDRARYLRVDATAEGSHTTTYIGGLFERTESPEGAVFRNFIGDFAIYSEVVPTDGPPTSSVHYIHRDHLDSVDVITDEQAQVVERFSYDAWGKRRNPDWTVATEPMTLASTITLRGFTNQEQIDGFSLVHMNGRVYDPTIGRFLSADPFIQSPGNLQSYNRYSYVLNNPLSFTDPSGFFSLKKALKSVFDFTVGKKSRIGFAIQRIRATLRAVAKVWAKVPGLQAFVGTVVCIASAGAGCIPFAAFSAAVSLSAGASLGDVALGIAIAYVTAGIADAVVGQGVKAGLLTKGSYVADQLSGGLGSGLASVAQGGKFIDGFKNGVLAVGGRAAGKHVFEPGTPIATALGIEGGDIPMLSAGNGGKPEAWETEGTKERQNRTLQILLLESRFDALSEALEELKFQLKGARTDRRNIKIIQLTGKIYRVLVTDTPVASTPGSALDAAGEAVDIFKLAPRESEINALIDSAEEARIQNLNQRTKLGSRFDLPDNVFSATAGPKRGISAVAK